MLRKDYVLTATNQSVLTRVEQSRSPPIQGSRCDQTISSEAAGSVICWSYRNSRDAAGTPETFVRAARYVRGLTVLSHRCVGVCRARFPRLLERLPEAVLCLLSGRALPRDFSGRAGLFPA